MLKKLVKYGNSNALVLDKALLEVLNIAEGSVVKIKTDGVSLIITPQFAEESLVPTITPEDVLKEVVQKHKAEFCVDPQNADVYMNELRAVITKYTGSLKKSEISAEMDKEIQAISQKYAKAEYQYKGQGKFATAFLDFKKVHEKYQHVSLQVAQLQENAEYIHESVLLAEKYPATKSSPEYLKEYTALIAKYIPEYDDYQKEIVLVAESMK